MPKLLDGKTVRDQILTELRPRVERIRTASGRAPGLAVVLVGADPASEIYVRNKVKTCQELGIFSEKLTPPATSTTEEILAIVAGLAARPEIDGILVQSPLPHPIDERRILLSIPPGKDVDGFHPYNVGQLVANNPAPRACTPAGVMELLRRNEINPSGKKAVVIGRSDIVGKPMAMLLLHAHATVTICHSRTSNLEAECRQADILVAAIGRPGFVRGNFVKPGAVVVDVGINRLATREAAEAVFAGNADKLAEFGKKGSLIVGDVHPLEMEHAAAVTPVPGGVGPLTIAMLMANTVALAEQHLGL
ncbi:MAG: bifunctional methylenetetrahydrofolate dehydrogenase/methenyltetrahydrofolate cyclohydrolase FolD [Bryobacterales bacterium]|nr:bifunctional methylenetetrahydrofolate dehydrogenase/methenyltetrahydrofolate cyclohydrolase FolD [Bryobacterales bacterium]